MEKQRVKCEFEYDEWISKNNVYTCRIEDKLISENAELVLIGQHVNKKTNQNVEGIHFGFCTLSKVPQGLTKIFPNLKYLIISISKMKIIEQEDLNEYKNLIEISFFINEISYLPGDLFDGMKNLEVISFNSNNIEVIEPNLLNGLEKLKYVNLKENPCISKCFDLIDNDGNATLKEIKDEIREKFSTPAWKVIFDERKRLIQTVAVINDKNKKLEQTVAKLTNEQNNGICGDLKKVIESEKLKDFIIQIDDEEFKVHKLLLAARSPVLKEMIENNIDAECLKLVDISKEIFREILNFIYTDELPQSNDANFLQLFAAAGRLKIENLKKFAAEKLICKVNSENALEILTLANKYDCEILRQKSFQIIKNELDGAEVSDNLALQPEKLLKILNLKKEKEKYMREMEMKLSMLLKEE